MSASRFHEGPYDAGTLLKLKIFELYVQEWVPVFISQPAPPFREVHIFDLFCGPGTDAVGVAGSPLRVLTQLGNYQRLGLAGWSKVKIAAHFSDADSRKTQRLEALLADQTWQVPGVQTKVSALAFRDALDLHRKVLLDRNAAKLLIIDQFGVDAVTDEIFKQLFTYPTTDFIFFLSSSTLNRFHDHPAIKIKIDRPDDSCDVHRAAFDWFQKLAPPGAFLGRFSIKKGSNIYGLIFGSRSPLGIHKFLQVAWRNDEICGEANFDIDRENISPTEMLLPLDELRPKKIQAFEAELESALRAGRMPTEVELVHFCIAAGMTCQHATAVLQKLKHERVIECDFWTPDIRRMRYPRLVTLIG